LSSFSIAANDPSRSASRRPLGTPNDRSIDVQVLRLRRKIETDPSQPQYIVTERGVGYSFSAPVEILY